MTAWHANDKFGFEFHNAHDLNKARDSSQEESIKRQLRERLANSKVFVVLIGEKTRYLTKFVRWEMEVSPAKFARLAPAAFPLLPRVLGAHVRLHLAA
jgi:hypothetical protein